MGRNIEFPAPSATELVLDLLVSHPRQAMPVQALAQAADVMGVGGAGIRVALTRLLRQGRIVKTARGCYALRPQGSPLHHEVEHWFERESRLVDWTGHWLVVHDAAVARGNKTAWRRHTHALDLYGFRELDAGMRVRPDNLNGGAQALRPVLERLGLARGAALFAACDFEAPVEARMCGLWNVRALQVAYRSALGRLERSGAKLPRLQPEAAARETLLVGRAVIRAIVRDPLLPEAIMPSAPRRALIEAMQAYQASARAVWLGLLGV